MPQELRVSCARGVTPGKWARAWAERFPRVPLALTFARAVTDAAAQAAPLRDGTAALAFVRLAPGADSPPGLHLIPLYEERAVVVAARGNAVESTDEVLLAELAGEVRHPFDDDIEQTMDVVAANVGVVVLPHSIARLYARKDVVARPVTDAAPWRIGLAWLREPGDSPTADPRIVDDFIGVVRGRTANSSRGGAPTPPEPIRERRPPRPARPARSTRGGRSRRRPTR